VRERLASPRRQVHISQPVVTLTLTPENGYIPPTQRRQFLLVRNSRM